MRGRFGYFVLFLLVLGYVSVSFAEGVRFVHPPVKLDRTGKKLMKQYADELDRLRAEIRKAAPDVSSMGDMEPRYRLAFAREYLGSDKLDAKLVKGAVLANATPKKLAGFAQKGKKQQKLVEKLLGDVGFMKRMLVAGGAKDGRYGRAMEIYTDILAASDRAGKGIFNYLALGTALEHAEGVVGFDVPTLIDPVKRYLSYEKAYLNGELDPAFKTFNDWECRHITNSNAPDEQLAWGRKMLANYRPDHMLRNDKLQYSMLNKTDLVYKEPEWRTRPKTYQQLLAGGGRCGPYAWFGRFILKAHGIPVWGVRQIYGIPRRGDTPPQHAALARWTVDGWKTNFGMHWRHNWWEDTCGLNFLLDTKARAYPDEYMKALRSEWTGDLLGQAKPDGMNSRPTGGPWYVMAYHHRKAIASKGSPGRAGHVSFFKDADVQNKIVKFRELKVSDADKKISISAVGVITIPAASCSRPRVSSNSVIFMKSILGGMQMHHARTAEEKGKSKTAFYDPVFEYTFDVPKAGKYVLTSNVVTVNRDQNMILTVNESASPITIDVPYTIGMWGQATPVTIKLKKGENKLHFTRMKPYYGLTIKDFKLTPVK